MSTLTGESLLQQLNWRYATKKFDPTRQIPAADWAVIEQALVLSPSSYGLQPWKFIVVTDPALKAKLRPATWNQSQVTECSHYVILTAKQDLTEADVAKVRDLVEKSGFDHINPENVTKVASAKQLYNFDALKNQRY